MEFSLWIETEHVEDPITDFGNVLVKWPDGTEWALNVWTYDFFTTTRAHPETSASPELARTYMFPPDLFVEDLTRSTLEDAIGDIAARGSAPHAWTALADT